MRTYYYFNPHTPGSGGDQWTEILEQAVRLASEQGYIDEAQLGSVGISSVVIDDPTATAGHEDDAILGLKQFWIDESDCPDIYEDPDYGQRLWTGYTLTRRYYRGDDSLITDGARKIDVELGDLNSFLSFRLILPEDVDATSSFDRPAETDIERVAALLTDVDYLSTTLFDLGFVASSGGVAMDACDYAGQRPADVLNDCALASGRTYFVYYDEASNSLGLWYDFESSTNYVSPLRLTNVLAEVDDLTTFAIKPDAVLERDPSRVVAGVLLDYDGGSVYRTLQETSYTYGWRDATAPSSNVKSQAKAEARADRFLADNATESDLVTCSVDLPSTVVTGIKAGQRLPCHFSHLPGYEDGFHDFRVVRRELAMPYATTERYEMRLELSPVEEVPITWTDTFRVLSDMTSDQGAFGDYSPVTAMLRWGRTYHVVVHGELAVEHGSSSSYSVGPYILAGYNGLAGHPFEGPDFDPPFTAITGDTFDYEGDINTYTDPVWDDSFASYFYAAQANCPNCGGAEWDWTFTVTEL